MDLVVHLSCFTGDYSSAAESKISRSELTKIISAKKCIKSNVTQLTELLRLVQLHGVA